jgi:hypothetical protein
MLNSDASRRSGAKVKPEDEMAGESWRSSPKARSEGWRSARVDGWLEGELEDATADEGLDVGPKVKSEEAVSGASWKLI